MPDNIYVTTDLTLNGNQLQITKMLIIPNWRPLAVKTSNVRATVFAKNCISEMTISYNEVTALSVVIDSKIISLSYIIYTVSND